MREAEYFFEEVILEYFVSRVCNATRWEAISVEVQGVRGFGGRSDTSFLFIFCFFDECRGKAEYGRFVSFLKLGGGARL